MNATDSFNDFGLDLFNVLRHDKPDSNVLISPVSIMTALSMTLLGAKGKTEAEMTKSLKIEKWELDKWHSSAGNLLQEMQKGKDSTPSPMNVANKVFIEKSFEILSSFTNGLQKNYKAEEGSVNFKSDAEGATATINEWVKKETKDKIPKLLDPGTLDSLTRVVLVNAVHFKGNWKSKFRKMSVSDETFHVNPSKTMQVKMMYQKTKVPFSMSEDAIAIQLPFIEEGFSMHFILPTERFGLKKLEEKLLKNQESLNALLSNSSSHDDVEIYIPKFKLKNNMDLIPSLRSLGINDLFNEGTCDLSGVSGNNDLYVSSVIHEATIEVSEEGAEAAAATATVMVTFCAAPPGIVFYADQPFLVAISFNGSLLFFGRIAEPNLN